MQRDDSILLPTRILGAVIAPILVLAVIMLYLLPGETDRHWSWPISPQLTAMYMGAGYASGAYFFTRVVFARSWRSVGLGLLPITAFTTFMFLATVLHWDNFKHGHVSFWLWTFLYVVTPVLVPAVWLLNHRTDPGRPPGALLLPTPVRGVLAVGGALLVALALLMLFSPSTVIDDWLWPLSELTARVVAAFIVLTGGLLLMVAYDGTWSASRVHIETFGIGTVLMFIAIIRDWGNLDPSEALRWGYLASVLVGLGLLAALYGWMENRARSTEPSAPLREAPG